MMKPLEYLEFTFLGIVSIVYACRTLMYTEKKEDEEHAELNYFRTMFKAYVSLFAGVLSIFMLILMCIKN